MTPQLALSIAGSDSGGGAGIQADLRTFAALGVLGATAVTCVTAQNTIEVRDILAVPPGLVRSQVEAVLSDMTVAAAKTGLLPTEALVKEVAALAADLPALVVDPVLSASSGHRFADEAVIRAYRDLLFGCAAVVTPNLVEAGVLLGANRELRSLDDARWAAQSLGTMARFVIVTGGHTDSPGVCVDVAWDGKRCWELSRPRLKTNNTHGGGCTFSAALTAGLARGMGELGSVRLANHFVHKAIQGSAGWRVGAGQGPLDHFGWEEAK